MIDFEDFVPQIIQQGGFLTAEQIEYFEECVHRANTWISKYNVDVVNIETVVLPNIHKQEETGSTDPSIRTSGDHSSYWYQFVRVWYNR